MELGDRYLVVQRAALGQGPGRSNAGGGYGPPTDINMAVQKVVGTGSESQPTRVLQMLNMVAPEDVLDDRDYEEILEDTKEEYVLPSSKCRILIKFVLDAQIMVK